MASIALQSSVVQLCQSELERLEEIVQQKTKENQRLKSSFDTVRLTNKNLKLQVNRTCYICHSIPHALITLMYTTPDKHSLTGRICDWLYSETCLKQPYLKPV